MPKKKFSYLKSFVTHCIDAIITIVSTIIIIIITIIITIIIIDAVAQIVSCPQISGRRPTLTH